MSLRQEVSPSFPNVSMAIRQEIHRFESVHPVIYSLYDLIENIPNIRLRNDIRDHVINIEDSFVNSPEWTISRCVTELRLGILGYTNSGKSALVHRYLTGVYLQEESPEGGRFKKEVTVDGQSYLLLIRDEGGIPESQFAQWADAVLLVFGLDDFDSFEAIHMLYTRLAYYRDMRDVPVLLVGTQDAISETSPRVVDDSGIRQMTANLRQCPYHETCATYGLNIERVFQDACHRIVQSRMARNPALNRQSSSSDILASRAAAALPQVPLSRSGASHFNGDGHARLSEGSPIAKPFVVNEGLQTTKMWQPVHNSPVAEVRQPGSNVTGDVHISSPQWKPSGTVSSVVPDVVARKSASLPDHASRLQPPSLQTNGPTKTNVGLLTPILSPKQKNAKNVQKSYSFNGPAVLKRFSPVPVRSNAAQNADVSLLSRSTSSRKSFADRHTPGADDQPDGFVALPNSTPGQARKQHRRSNFFGKKVDEDKDKDKKGRNEDAKHGIGRSIPVKQGFLYKKSGKPLSKEWKKKYVTLLDNGHLHYFPSLNDYMDNSHGKEIVLGRTTVKIPGGRPRGSEAPRTCPKTSANGHLVGVEAPSTGSSVADSSSGVTISSSASDGNVVVSGDRQSPLNTNLRVAETPLVKKKHRRARSGARHFDANVLDSEMDGYEFTIVSLDGHQWFFEASTSEERDEWMIAIEKQILSSLQLNDSNKSKVRNSTASDVMVAASIKSVEGNQVCADCGSANPDWASLNLGVLVCIECSGVHRNLGTHLSRVRSLDLDDWPSELVSVMMSIGNSMANAVWEAELGGRTKPSSSSSREEKERWIRSKYERREFLPPLPYQDVPFTQVGQLLSITDLDCVSSGSQPSGSSLLQRGQLVLIDQVWKTVEKSSSAEDMSRQETYGADAMSRDHEGHDPLYYAQVSNVPGAAICGKLLQTAQGACSNDLLNR